jgi:hypothetical protein
MSDIVVTPMEPGTYGVQITEGQTTTSVRVAVPPDLLDDLGLTAVDPELVVRESIGFLLDREPATAIMSEFSLSDIPRFFPDYYGELTARLSG